MDTLEALILEAQARVADLLAVKAYLADRLGEIEALNAEIATLNARIAQLEAQLAAQTPQPTLDFFCDWSRPFSDYAWSIQAKANGRVSVIQDVFGRPAVRLLTMPGDTNIAGSGANERCDLVLTKPGTSTLLPFNEGEEHWWVHSVLFPDDYVVPPTVTPWSWSVVFTFHHTGPTGQSNLNLFVHPGNRGLVLAIASGPTVINGPPDPGYHVTSVGPLVKNIWYDFVYHVKWSATEGYLDAWVNGARKLSHRGPTLYSGMGCYLKLQNYHTAVGQPSAVCHGTVKRGSTIESLGFKASADWQSVSAI